MSRTVREENNINRVGAKYLRLLGDVFFATAQLGSIPQAGVTHWESNMKVLGGILGFLSFGAFANGDVGLGLFLAVGAVAAFGAAPKWRRVGGGNYEVYRKE